MKWRHIRLGSAASEHMPYRATLDKAPPRGKAPPHLNTNLVCEWVHLMSNDAPCWKSVYEPNKLELNKNVWKYRIFVFFTYLDEGGALLRSSSTVDTMQ